MNKKVVREKSKKQREREITFVFISVPQIIFRKGCISQSMLRCCFLNAIFIHITQPKFG